MYAKQTGDVNKAIEFSHNLKSLWTECKSNDINFMPQYQMRDAYYDFHLVDWDDLARNNKPEFDHIIYNLPWYLVAKDLANWKYFYARQKSHSPVNLLRMRILTTIGFPSSKH